MTVLFYNIIMGFRSVERKKIKLYTLYFIAIYNAVLKLQIRQTNIFIKDDNRIYQTNIGWVTMKIFK